MRRTKRALSYLVQTTQADGSTNHDTALFGERETRLVEHGWRTDKFGETTDIGQELAHGLHTLAREHYQHIDAKSDRIERLADENGVPNVVDLALSD